MRVGEKDVGESGVFLVTGEAYWGKYRKRWRRKQLQKLSSISYDVHAIHEYRASRQPGLPHSPLRTHFHLPLLSSLTSFEDPRYVRKLLTVILTCRTRDGGSNDSQRTFCAVVFQTYMLWRLFIITRNIFYWYVFQIQYHVNVRCTC